MCVKKVNCGAMLTKAGSCQLTMSLKVQAFFF